MELLRGGNSRRVAVAVAIVADAVCSHVFLLRRLRELPDFREPDAALGWAWRVSGRTYRKRAAGCGRAGVVDRPVNDLAASSAVANIFRGHYIAIVFRRNAGAVDASAEPRGGDAVNPRIDVGLLLGQHAAALFLVEKDDGFVWKAFAVGCCSGSLRIGVAELRGVGNRF